MLPGGLAILAVRTPSFLLTVNCKADDYFRLDVKLIL